MLMEPLAAKPAYLINPMMQDDDFTGYSLNSKKAVQVWISRATKKADRWFKIWSTDWLNELRMHPVTSSVTNHRSGLEPRVGDSVLVIDPREPRRHWSVGEVTDLVYSSDGMVRSAYVVYIDFFTGKKKRALKSTCHLACMEIFDEERVALQEAEEDEDTSEEPTVVQESPEMADNPEVQEGSTSTAVPEPVVLPPNRKRKSAVEVRRNPRRNARKEADKMLSEMIRENRI
jgi:hypothetical protein